MLRLLPVKNPTELVLLDHHGSHLGSNRGENAFSYSAWPVFPARLWRLSVPAPVRFSQPPRGGMPAGLSGRDKTVS